MYFYNYKNLLILLSIYEDNSVFFGHFFLINIHLSYKSNIFDEKNKNFFSILIYYCSIIEIILFQNNNFNYVYTNKFIHIFNI